MTAIRRIRSLLAAHHGLPFLGGSAVVMLVVGVVALVAHAEEEPAPRSLTATPTTTTTTTTEPPPPPPVAPLTGVEGTHDGRIDRPALFVKIDNVPRARPQAGLNRADIIFEEPVEGNVTRLAAVFHSTDAGSIGPVRSTRTTDVELVSLFGRVLFASSGGNIGVMRELYTADLVDIGHNTTGQGFYRFSGRPAPHNLFTSSTDLYTKAPEQPPPPRQVFSYLAAGEELAPNKVRHNGVALRYGGGEVSRFLWDPETGRWPREQAGTPHLDSDDVQVAPVNVVVLEIDYDRSGQLGRSVPHGIVTGEGSAVVLTQGHAIPGRWVRPTLADPLQLLDPDGNVIKLTPGQTFVALPSIGGATYL